MGAQSLSWWLPHPKQVKGEVIVGCILHFVSTDVVPLCGVTCGLSLSSILVDLWSLFPMKVVIFLG
jgi:hypothetical protein